MSRLLPIVAVIVPAVAVMLWQAWDDDFAGSSVIVGSILLVVSVALAYVDARYHSTSIAARLVRGVVSAALGAGAAVGLAALTGVKDFSEGVLGFAFLGAVVALWRARQPADDIHVIESLTWSWRRGGPALATGIGLILWAVIGTWADRGGKLDFSDLFISMAFLIATILALFGFRPGLPSLKTFPNQGIRTTAWYALRVGLGVFLVTALPFFVLDEMTTGLEWLDPFPNTDRHQFIAVTALITATAVMLMGGKEVVRHFWLRTLLWLTGALPLRLPRFLDYAAAQLQILQKVGGGYIFVHRLLLEHFADQAPRPSLLAGAATILAMVAFGAGPDAATPGHRLATAAPPPVALNAQALADGDLVFRAGRSFDSRLIRIADRESPYSHVGLIDLQDGVPYVLHVEPSADPAEGRVRREPLRDYLDATKSDGYAVYRVSHGRSGVADAALAAARGYLAAGITFDCRFDLETSSAMYCTELVWRAYLAAGVDLTAGRLDGPYPLGPRRAVRLSRLMRGPAVTLVAEDVTQPLR